MIIRLAAFVPLAGVIFALAPPLAAEDALTDCLFGGLTQERQIESCQHAAEQGDALAMGQLGLMYYEGQGVLQDYAEAVAWFRRAAENGNAATMTQLGNMYQVGLGVPQDYAEAVAWYRRAIEQGDELARLSLGLMYQEGWGVPQDFVLAHMWWNLAAASTGFYARTSDLREMARGLRDELANRMSREQVEEAQRQAREWKASNP